MYEWMDNYRKEHGILKGDFQWGSIPFDVMKTYAAMDALCTYLIYEKFKKIKENPKLKWVYDNILIPGTRFLIDAQDNGVPFDKKRLYAAQEVMQDDIDTAVNGLYKNPIINKWEKYNGKDFNPNSTVQLRSLLFDYLDLQPTGKKTGTGAHSTDAEVLQELDPSRKFHDLSLTYVNDPKLKILTWTKSYRSWIEIADYVHRSTFMVLLAVGSVLVVSLICSSFLGITLP